MKLRKHGENDRVFKYITPILHFRCGNGTGTKEAELPSGVEVANALRESEELDFDMIEEITPGYYMIHDIDDELIILQPCWYYLIKDNWFASLQTELRRW